jgi:hypothetical protein
MYQFKCYITGNLDFILVLVYLTNLSTEQTIQIRTGNEERIGTDMDGGGQEC